MQQLQGNTDCEAAVLFIETKSTVFGGQKALLARCSELDRLGVAYRIIHPFSESAFLTQYQRLGLRGAVLTPQEACGKIGQIVFILRHLRQLASMQRTIHCDAFDSAYLISALRMINFFRDTTLIFTIRSERYLRFNALDRFLLGSFDRLCTNSEYSRDQICAVTDLKPADITVTNSPIDFSALEASQPKDLRLARAVVTFGYVGSFDKRKRLDRFVEFGLEVMAKMPDRAFQFRIYGVAKTEEQTAIEKQARTQIANAGMEKAFQFVGYVPTTEIATQIDILFCPFDNEPLGRVVPEFLFMGIPVIAHDDGGLREAGIGAARMITGDNEDELRANFFEAVESLLSAAPPTEGETQALRETLVERFGVRAVIEAELALYQLSVGPGGEITSL